MMQNFGEFSLKVAESGDPSDMMAYTTAETAAVDAALKQVRQQAYTADAAKVSKSGDIMSGWLTVPTLNLTGSGRQYSISVLGNGGLSIRPVVPGSGAWVTDGIQISPTGVVAVPGAFENGGGATFNGPVKIGDAGAVDWVDASNYQFLLRYPNNGTVARINYPQMHQFVYAMASQNPSSRRFKTDIQPADDMPDVSALTPVKFRFRSDAHTPLTEDQRTSPQLGLIAEDVADVDPRLVQRDDNGQVHGLDYAALIAALVAKCQQLEARIAQLEGS